jgi:pilus assembly protein CpaB
MNRTTRFVVVLVIAVLTASAASVGVYLAVRRIPARRVEAPTVSMVVAARPLEMGIRLAKQDVKLIPWPERSPIEGAFKDIEQVVDHGLIAPVVANEPITVAKLAPGHDAGLAPAIRPGMRAMSVKVNEVIGVAGFVVPGARVDVIVTVRQDRDSTSCVVVSNVMVLTAGTRYDQGEVKKEAKPIPTTVVTLMVSPADAERVALAASEGQIMLALRNPLDAELAQRSCASTADLLAGIARARAGGAARPNAPAAPPPRTVETFKGTKRGSEVIR